MTLALRALLLLAAVTPVFAATGFSPHWWQILLAAVVGSALGQLAVRLTRDRRVAQGGIAGIAVIVVAVVAAWSLRRPAPHADSTGNTLLIARPVTWDDVQALTTEIPSIEFAVPYVRTPAQLANADQNWNTQVVGTTPDYLDLMGLRVAAGDRFEAHNRVVMLGDTVVKQLYGAAASPVGEVIRIKNIPFTVVGVLAHQGTPALDDVALIPIDVYESKLAATTRFSGAVLISATSRDALARVEEAVRSLLRDRHRLAPGAADDFTLGRSNPDGASIQ